MKQIFEDSQNLELQKKNKILQARSEADKRQKMLFKEQERNIQVKKSQNKEREMYQKKVREVMIKNREDEVNQLINARESKEE